MRDFSFEPATMPAGIATLRAEVRDFLARELPAYSVKDRARSWSGFDPDFSRKLGQQGWIGMTWPRQYGGHERSHIERYVVLEELLAAGAPVGAHWIADRQSGNLLLRYGTEAQCQAFLPGMAAGELYFCIGMSEPGSGSDLAAARTRATPVDGGWKVNGSKLWTTAAHRVHYMIALVRTEAPSERRHAGFSQLLIDLKSPGITIRPIIDMAGDAHFNEVFFEDTFVPADCLVGEAGGGWGQVTAELSLERSGPERFLSSHLLLEAFVDSASEEDPGDLEFLGQAGAELWTLRQMSLSVASQLAAGHDPAVEASIVKDLGAVYEQGLPQHIQGLLTGQHIVANPELEVVLDFLMSASPAFSLRGGTREILRGIIARGLGLR